MTTTSKEPLFSVVLIGRNDNYGGLFLKRLNLCINYLSYGMNKIDNNIDYEVVVVDWSSDQPLSDVLDLTPEAAENTSFIRVKPELAADYNPEGMNFNSPVSFNTGVVRANGKYILHMPADILFTHYSLSRLCDILSRSIPLPFAPENSLMLVKRFTIPEEYHETEKSFEELNRYLTLSTNWLEYNYIINGVSADFGGLVFTKEAFIKNGGFDEELTNWGKSDSRFGFTANSEYPIYELSGFGVQCYDPTVNNTNIKKKVSSGNKACDIDFTAKTRSIGLAGQQLHTYKSTPHKCQSNNPVSSGKTPDHSELTGNTLFKRIAKALPFNATSVLPYMYPLFWYIEQNRVDTFCEFVSDVESTNRYLPDFMLTEDSSASLLSALNPSAEIISIIPAKSDDPDKICHKTLGRQYLNKKSGKLPFIKTLINEVFPNNNLLHKWHPGFATQMHHGLVHYITGSIDNAIPRTIKRFDGRLKADIILFRTTASSDNSRILSDILDFISDSGLIIIIDRDNSLLDNIKNNTDAGYSAFIDTPSNLGLIMKNDRQNLISHLNNSSKTVPEFWKPRLLPFNCLKSIIFNILITIKKYFER